VTEDAVPKRRSRIFCDRNTRITPEQFRELGLANCRYVSAEEVAFRDAAEAEPPVPVSWRPVDGGWCTDFDGFYATVDDTAPCSWLWMDLVRCDADGGRSDTPEEARRAVEEMIRLATAYRRMGVPDEFPVIRIQFLKPS
jgi:hypothetical protein